MRGPHNIWRLIRTGATLERTGAMGVVLDAFDAPAHLRLTAHILGWPFKWLGLKGDLDMPPAPRALTALGPAYIKFGQVLSTRPDVVGDELAKQLTVLQDKLPPFSTEIAKQSIAQELGENADVIFSDFSPAVAAASIAQVHRATLRQSGEEVAVKVLRPDIERAFRTDLDAFFLAARIVEVLSPASRRLRPMDVITHFESVVFGELDLRLESSAASEFAANTGKDDGFTLPVIKWPYSSRRVMTMSWAEGVPMGDNAAIDAAGHDRQALSTRVLQLFLSHALRDGYFHADMHQGNMKVAPNGDIIAYDFGIMGHIDEYTRRVYAEILFGFIRKDFKRVAEVHFEAGYVPADKDVDEFARALRAVGEPIFGMDADKISMARLLSYLFEVTERFGYGNAHRTDFIATHYGGCRGRSTLFEPADEHLENCTTCCRGLYQEKYRTTGCFARSIQYSAGSGALWTTPSRTGRGSTYPAINTNTAAVPKPTKQQTSLGRNRFCGWNSDIIFNFG